MPTNTRTDILPLVVFGLLVLGVTGCPENPSLDDDTGDDDDLTEGDDDTTVSDDDTTVSDDDSATALTPLAISYRCVSHGGDGSPRPWYFFDPWSLYEPSADELAYEEDHNITRTLPGDDAVCDGAIWHWDVQRDQFPMEPGWFTSPTIDLEEFHGIERIMVVAYQTVPNQKAVCAVVPDIQLQMRGGTDAASLSDWSVLDLENTDEYPTNDCLRQWQRSGEQPPWAGRYLQFRLELDSDPSTDYVQSALPLYIEYMTTVPYYYWVQNSVYSTP